MMNCLDRAGGRNANRSIASLAVIVFVPLSIHSQDPSPLAGKTVDYEVEIKVSAKNALGSPTFSNERKKRSYRFTRDGSVYISGEKSERDKGSIWKLNGEVNFLSERWRIHPLGLEKNSYEYARGKSVLTGTTLSFESKGRFVQKADGLKFEFTDRTTF